MNDVLEGRPLTIDANQGEVVAPHPMFRVVVTGNSCGNGDALGVYQGVQQQNLAAMDRFMTLSVGYMDEVQETALLEKAVPRLQPTGLLQKMVKKMKDVVDGTFDLTPIIESVRTEPPCLQAENPVVFRPKPSTCRAPSAAEPAKSLTDAPVSAVEREQAFEPSLFSGLDAFLRDESAEETSVGDSSDEQTAETTDLEFPKPFREDDDPDDFENAVEIGSDGDSEDEESKEPFDDGDRPVAAPHFCRPRNAKIPVFASGSFVL